ncbi:MAG: HNH endonuclease [Fibrella sp.]|nr:HNH endonuclease [Armatimonadota bacterium]
MNCIQDQVPVGVFIQPKGKPGPRYRILGIALPVRWTNGYFLFEGDSPLPLHIRETVTPYLTATPDDLTQLLTETEIALNLANVFDPTNLADSREKVVAAILRRRGQPAFRQSLIQAYSGRCAITQFDAIDALEAGHILPYRGIQTSVVSNGLLLRADVHTLFDLGQIAVDSDTMTVVLKNHLQKTKYSTLSGSSLHLPDNRALHPDMQALAMHRAWAGI